MSGKKFIGYFDILGFKDLAYNNSHEVLYNLYNTTFSAATLFSIAGEKLSLNETNSEENNPIDGYVPKINSLIISDSIVIWTDDNSMKSFIKIIVAAKSLLINLFSAGLPLRGTIVEGNLDKINRQFAENHSQITLLGLGLVEAYIKESEQDWSGCIVDQNCIDLYEKLVIENKDFPDIATLEYLIKVELLLKYNVPKKSGEIKDYYVINWIKHQDKKLNFTESQIRTKFSQHGKSTNNWKVEKIITNTIDFFKFIN